MPDQSVERKLAAIFAADIAGYSRLMAHDEVGTLARLKAYRSIIDDLIAAHRGRIFNTAGDSVVADFASAVDAVQCAVAVQAAITIESAKEPADEPMRFRIGVHAGDVIVDGSNLLGDGVNIAARLESLADPGTICVSGAARDHIGNKLPLAFDDLGERQVKNIPETIRVYRVQTETPTPPPVAALPLPDKPSIAVLPFQNMSGDPDQEYFADGMVEEIITALSRWETLVQAIFSGEVKMSAIQKLAVLVLAAGLSTPAYAADENWARVGEALGKAGTEMPGGVYRVGLPRSDIKATLDGVELKPGFALGGWVAFEKSGKDSMMMGDLVLTGEEVGPVMQKLLDGGIAVTALHNHLLRNEPFTMYMHVLGMGDPVKLATAVHTALAASKTPLGPVPAGGAQPQAAPAAAPPQIDLDTAAIDQTLGAKGNNNGGVLQYGIPRAEPVKEGGMTVPVPMGSGQAINFQPTGGVKAAITGDFVLSAKEVAPVMQALRANGIEVTALHNHMLNDEPRLFFMHFWANDDAKKLAQGLKAALSHIHIAKG